MARTCRIYDARRLSAGRDPADRQPSGSQGDLDLSGRRGSMRTLAIDTACMTATCAVLENGAVLAEYALHGARTHSQKLLPMVSSICLLYTSDAADDLLCVDL